MYKKNTCLFVYSTYSIPSLSLYYSGFQIWELIRNHSQDLLDAEFHS